ncbi:MAG TPA: hypothetical protein VKA67_06755 [Verrucomicrobiae bacterium]|nr:hypothetical protein [Verrucomicrobiae bacterium]
MARWHSCNVLQTGNVEGRLWRFDIKSKEFKLHRELPVVPSQILPANLVAKDWRSLFQPSLNVAWLPPEHVFLRVIQLPKSTLDETISMVELQLEKLSPVPVGQIVWTIQVLSRADGEMQTVIAVIAARNAVEGFLGQLEGQGYLADRLELPLLEQLQATPIQGDGAWIYPGAQGGKGSALVAWWCDGVLQNISLVTLSADAAVAAAELRDQLAQMAWAGELEGWVFAAPKWHLVADASTAEEWGLILREAVEQSVEVVPPLNPQELAELTAKRAASTEIKVNLLPPEFTTRYRQQFQDRLWMRGLTAVIGLYLAGLAVYFLAVGVLSYRTHGVENQVRSLALNYTNTIQLKARYAVLKERQELKYAALDCWKAVAETMPESITLDSLGFSDGKKLMLSGTAPAGDTPQVLNFNDAIRKYQVEGQPLFDAAKSEPPSTRVNPGNTTVSWNFSLELKHSEKP